MKKNTIQRKLIFSFSLLFLSVLICICGVVSVRSFSSQKMQYEQSTQNLATQVASTIDTYFYEIENLIISTSTNKNLLENWRNSNTADSYTALCTRQEIKSFFNSVLQSRTDIASIALFDESRYIGSDNYKEIGLENDYLKQVWASFQTDQSYKARYYGYHVLDYQMRPYSEGFPEVILLAYPIRDINSLSHKNEALLIFELYHTALATQVSRTNGMDTVVILTDESGIIQYCTSTQYEPGQQLPPLQNSSFPDYLWNNAEMASNGWQVIVLQPLSLLNRETVHTLLLIIILFSIVVIITISIVIAISKQLALPVELLSQSMNSVDLEHHETLSMPNQGRNIPYEIKNLYEKYNQLLDRISSLKIVAYEATIKQKEANYLALQSQINPHFLNNVLQTIQSLAVLQRCEEIQYVVTSMADWLEYTLYAETDFVTVSEEVKHVLKYLQLYQYRLGEDFRYAVHLDNDCANIFVPRFIIQPLVENAVLHGLNGVKNGCIVINGQILEEKMYLSIQDNGVGIDAETLKAITLRLENDLSGGPSIGLCNVNQRIRLLYGSDYGLELQSEVGHGTCATLVLPVEKGSEKENTREDA